MPLEFIDSHSTDKDDHYVAFLSSGINPSASYQQQIKKKLQRPLRLANLARFAIFLFVLFLIAGILIVLLPVHSPADDPTQLATAALSKLQSTDLNFVLSQGDLTSGYVQAFEEFVVKHGKVYASLQEKTRRLEIFAKNLVYINLHNAQNFTYSLAANAFTDLTLDEFKAQRFTRYRKRHGLLGGEGNIDWSLLDVEQQSLPETLSWKDKGCVTKVKDQRNCGSCWAFSAAGAVEGAYCAKHGKLIAVSIQQMVDCAGPEGNEGCNGGEMDDAFQYVIDHGGLCRDDAYPYTSHESECRDNECSSVEKVQKFADVPRSSDKALKAAVALKGPISVAIQADQTPFQFYHEGVFDSPCGYGLNHGVLVVGYGRDSESGQDYWLVKNSWGPKWGDNGFIKMLRNDGSKGGKCGLLLDASFPVVD